MVVTRRMKKKQKPDSLKNGTELNIRKDSNENFLVSNGKNRKKSHCCYASRITRHLAPYPLIVVIIICSGPLWLISFRDIFATGRPLFDLDSMLLKFTKSTRWYDDSKGWKSKMGGMSSVQRVTTDDNNMGGLFVRKVSGVAGMAYHLHKLLPLLVRLHTNADWRRGHFNLLLSTCVIGNICLIIFYIIYLEDLNTGGAGEMAILIVSLLGVEAFVMFVYVLQNVITPCPDIVPKPLPPGKTPNSLVSNITARTVSIVSGIITILSARDLLFPGKFLHFPPRDDIYLEWTGAFLHSPPVGSPENEIYGLTAPLLVGEKFCSRLMGLYLLLGCMQKFIGAFGVRIGEDGISGAISTKMFWTVQALGDGMLLFVLRIFSSAANSASLDLRWHLMSLGYETGILALMAFA